MAAHGRRPADAQRRGGDPPFPRGSLTLVLDASAALYACLVERGFRPFGREELVGPPLLWPEVRSALHESASRGALARGEAEAALARLGRAPIAMRSPGLLGAEAWRIADDFGWMKTYDAEYVALAAILRCRLVTADEALRRATSRLGFVIRPTEI